MKLQLLIVVALVGLPFGSCAAQPQPSAPPGAESPPSTPPAGTSSNAPTLTLTVRPCYFHIQAGKAVFGWPKSDDRRGKKEPETVEVKAGFAASISLVGAHQIKLRSPDVQGVVRTKEGGIVQEEGVTVPFITRDGWNQPGARTESYTQVIDSYMMPLPAAAEMVIGPRVYEVDGAPIATDAVVFRHVSCGEFEACCVSSEKFRAGKEGFVELAFLRKPSAPHEPGASITVSFWTPLAPSP